MEDIMLWFDFAEDEKQVDGFDDSFVVDLADDLVVEEPSSKFSMEVNDGVELLCVESDWGGGGWGRVVVKE